jgi:hypothetical protein
MNLAKLGLLKDSKGKIVKPQFVSSQSASDQIVELEDIVQQVVFQSSPTIHLAINPRSMDLDAFSKSFVKNFEIPKSKSLPPPSSYTPPYAGRKRRVKLSKKFNETPDEYRERVKNENDIVDLEQDINTMNLKTLRKHFGYKNGKIKVGVFARNVIWQVARLTEQGKAPFFVAKGGNVRSLWYYVRTLVETHSRSFSVRSRMEGIFSSELSTLSGVGLISYLDLNFIDVNRADRWVAPDYGTRNVILMAEKRAFSEEFVNLGKHYGVTVQAAGGQPSRVTVENLLLDMHSAGHDLTKPFTVFSLVDCDPAGWNIASSFIEAMLELGLHKVKHFWPYGRKRPRQPWIDIVSVKDLEPSQIKRYRHPLKVGKRAMKVANEWLRATGGLYGKGGLSWALDSTS